MKFLQIGLIDFHSVLFSVGRYTISTGTFVAPAAANLRRIIISIKRRFLT